MRRIRQILLPAAAGIGVAAAILTAPLASAEDGQNLLLPPCEVTGGSAVTGGQTTDCASPGNVQIDSTPQVFPGEDEFYGFPGFGFF